MSRETGTDEILCDVRERVATITLNRPEAKNALTMEMKEALYCLVRDLEDDAEVGCFLLTRLKAWLLGVEDGLKISDKQTFFASVVEERTYTSET